MAQQYLIVKRQAPFTTFHFMRLDLTDPGITVTIPNTEFIKFFDVYNDCIYWLTFQNHTKVLPGPSNRIATYINCSDKLTGALISSVEVWTNTDTDSIPLGAWYGLVVDGTHAYCVACDAAATSYHYKMPIGGGEAVGRFTSIAPETWGVGLDRDYYYATNRPPGHGIYKRPKINLSDATLTKTVPDTLQFVSIGVNANHILTSRTLDGTSTLDNGVQKRTNNPVTLFPIEIKEAHMGVGFEPYGPITTDRTGSYCYIKHGTQRITRINLSNMTDLNANMPGGFVSECCVLENWYQGLFPSSTSYAAAFGVGTKASGVSGKVRRQLLKNFETGQL